MSEPFVFHFTPGIGGRLEAMYILDLDCRCGLCGHRQFQRFYHSTPFHELTIPALERLAEEGALKAGYRCENCGADVGAEQVRHVCLTFGFADDAGLIRIFHDLQSDDVSYELTGRRRLDPQAMPRWSADPDAHTDNHLVPEYLDESTIHQTLNRPVNAKLAWRDLLTHHVESGDEELWQRITPELLAVAYCGRAPSPQRAAAFLRKRGHHIDTDDMVAIDLTDSCPEALPTRPDPASLHGRWESWSPNSVQIAIDDGTLRARAFVSQRPAIEITERTFEVGRLEYRRHETDGDIVYTDISSPSDNVLQRPLSIHSILHRAVYTGLTPGESARLTTEQIVGTLLEVW